MKIKLTTYEPPADLPACCICDFHTVEYYDESGNITGKAYCGISEQGAATYKVKAVYIDDDAKRFLWRQNFDRLDNTDRKAILAVFPDILQKDAATLKTVNELAKLARLYIMRHFGKPCTRCGGSGSYALSVAYTELHDGICHKCGGGGKELPRLTEKMIAKMTQDVIERRQAKK